MLIPEVNRLLLADVPGCSLAVVNGGATVYLHAHTSLDCHKLFVQKTHPHLSVTGPDSNHTRLSAAETL